jgi:carbon storage regulator
MLVLSRKVNEQIVIDERIVVTVLRIRGDTVRLGFEAPKDVAVHREEVYEAIKSGNEGLGVMAGSSERREFPGDRTDTSRADETSQAEGE